MGPSESAATWPEKASPGGGLRAINERAKKNKLKPVAASFVLNAPQLSDAVGPVRVWCEYLAWLRVTRRSRSRAVMCILRRIRCCWHVPTWVGAKLGTARRRQIFRRVRDIRKWMKESGRGPLNISVPGWASQAYIVKNSPQPSDTVTYGH